MKSCKTVYVGTHKVTEFQSKCIDLIRSGTNSTLSITELAARLNTSRLAVFSAMRVLVEQNIATQFRSGDDQWSRIMYSINDELDFLRDK